MDETQPQGDMSGTPAPMPEPTPAATPAPMPAAAPEPPAAWAPPPPPSAAAAMAGSGARPTGATVIGIIAGIEGVLVLLAALFVLTVGGGVLSSLDSFGTDVPNGAGGVLAGIGLFIIIILAIIGILYVLISYGMFRGRGWAWMLTAVVYIIALVFGVLGLTGGVSASNLIIGIALPIVVLYLLWQPDVKRWLGRA